MTALIRSAWHQAMDETRQRTMAHALIGKFVDQIDDKEQVDDVDGAIDVLVGRIFEIDNQPLPNDRLGDGIVVASVVYAEGYSGEPEPMGDFDTEDRFEVLVLRLMPDPYPAGGFYEVGTWDCRTSTPKAIGDQRRFGNVAEAVHEYRDMGGDI